MRLRVSSDNKILDDVKNSIGGDHTHSGKVGILSRAISKRTVPENSATLPPGRINDPSMGAWSDLPANVQMRIINSCAPGVYILRQVSRGFNLMVDRYCAKKAKRFRDACDEAECWGHSAPTLADIIYMDPLAVTAILKGFGVARPIPVGGASKGLRNIGDIKKGGGYAAPHGTAMSDISDSEESVDQASLRSGKVNVLSSLKDATQLRGVNAASHAAEPPLKLPPKMVKRSLLQNHLLLAFRSMLENYEEGSWTNARSLRRYIVSQSLHLSSSSDTYGALKEDTVQLGHDETNTALKRSDLDLPKLPESTLASNSLRRNEEALMNSESRPSYLNAGQRDAYEDTSAHTGSLSDIQDGATSDIADATLVTSGISRLRSTIRQRDPDELGRSQEAQDRKQPIWAGGLNQANLTQNSGSLSLWNLLNVKEPSQLGNEAIQQLLLEDDWQLVRAFLRGPHQEKETWWLQLNSELYRLASLHGHTFNLPPLSDTENPRETLPVSIELAIRGGHSSSLCAVLESARHFGVLWRCVDAGLDMAIIQHRNQRYCSDELLLILFDACYNDKLGPWSYCTQQSGWGCDASRLPEEHGRSGSETHAITSGRACIVVGDEAVQKHLFTNEVSASQLQQRVRLLIARGILAKADEVNRSYGLNWNRFGAVGQFGTLPSCEVAEEIQSRVRIFS